MKTAAGICILLYVLLLRILPVTVTVVLAPSTPPPSRTDRTGRVRFFILLISCGLHFGVYALLHRLFWHNFNFLTTAKRILLFQYTYQDIAYVPITLIISLSFGVALGYLLRLIVPGLFSVRDIPSSLPAGRKLFLAAFFAVSFFSSLLLYDCGRSGKNHIVLNEIGGNNYSLTFDDPENKYDYIELYNGGFLGCSLHSLFLSDDEDALQKLALPDDILPAGGYYLVKLDRSLFSVNRQGGEEIILSDQNGAHLDTAVTLAMEPDIATARKSDGSDVWGTFSATPGCSNAGAVEHTGSALTVSHPSGFYDEDFYLTLSAEPGYEIYYTLDGSVPTRDSIRYTEPLLIRDASPNPNVYSARTDLSTGFDTQMIAETEYEAPGYEAPDYPVDKCTILRAVGIREDGAVGELATLSYFVGLGGDAAYKNMNVVSLVTSPDNLFDYERGIYVTGVQYDQSMTNSSVIPYWWWWDGNYRLRGTESERDAHLTVFAPDRSMRLSQSVGIRIQGGGSRGHLPKSLNIYARERYDGHDVFQNTPFVTSYLPKRVTLFAGGDDNRYKLKDYLVATLVSDREFATMDFEPCVLFLDGEYWGNYWLTEKYDAEYLAYHYGVDPNDVIIIKGGALEAGNEADLAIYTDCLGTIENADLTVPENYEMACCLMDVDSLIDYFACEIYIARYNDWPLGNFALWRSRTGGGSGYSDGKWRWMLFDVNSGAMDPAMAETDTVSLTLDGSTMFARFMENETFRNQFYATLLELADTVFLPERVDAVIADYQALMAEPLNAEHMRFYGRPSTDWEAYVEDIRTFFHTRYNYIKSYLADYAPIE